VGILLIGYWSTLRTRPLQFQDVTDSGRVEGTENVYHIEAVEVSRPGGTEYTQHDLSVLNTATGQRFQLPVSFPTYAFQRERYWDSELDIWRERGDLTCPACIAVVNQGESTYLITDHHSGGSAAYSGSQIIRIGNDTAVEEMRHLSCGRPRIRRSQIILSNLEPDCPDWLWGPRWRHRWQITRFELN
jgi:hypothetical protein